jgi:hypothetical protein
MNFDNLYFSYTKKKWLKNHDSLKWKCVQSYDFILFLYDFANASNISISYYC